MSIFLITTLLLLSMKIDAAQHFKEFHLGRHDPAYILPMIYGKCQKNEDKCLDTIQLLVKLMTNMNVILASQETKPEIELMAMIESLINDLQHCKDTECVMDFERKHGKQFHLVLSKVSKIFHETSIIEKYAEDNHIFKFHVLE